MEIDQLPRSVRDRAQRLIKKPGFQTKFSKVFFEALKRAEKNGCVKQAGLSIIKVFEKRWRNANAADLLHRKLQKIAPRHTISYKTPFGAHLKITCLHKDASYYRVRLNDTVTVYLKDADNSSQPETRWKTLEICLYLGEFVGNAEFVVDVKKKRVAITEKEAFAILSKNEGLALGPSEHHFKKWLLANRLTYLKRGQKITRKLGKTTTFITKTDNHLELQTTTGLKILIELPTNHDLNRPGYLKNGLANLTAKRNRELYAVVGEVFATKNILTYENPLATFVYRYPTKFFVDKREVSQTACSFLEECLAKNKSPSIEILMKQPKKV